MLRPRLFGRLAAQARVSVVSAPAGSGKTVLLRSWISWAGMAGRVAWVPAGRGERDPQRFWLSVLAALRQTAAGSALVRELTAAPDLDGWVITERLLADLAPLDDQLWLVVDDVHELGPDALRQLELLILRAPPGLRFVLATRHDVRLGLHRLRLEGELAEIREPDLRFTMAEAEELFDAAGVDLPDPAPLVERTEGWAAGLRLEQVGLLTVEPVSAPPTVRISPVLQAALRAAMPEDLPDQAGMAAADALLQAWPEPEEPGWPASSLRSCVATLRRITGDLLWDGGCHPLLVRAGDSLDRARLTEAAVDHWRDLATTAGRLLGGGHPDTVLAGRRLADAYLAAGCADDAIPWFQWVLDSLTHKLGPDHRDVIEAQRRLGHAFMAALQPSAAITVLRRVIPQFEQVCGPSHADTLGARDELAAAYLAAGQNPAAVTLYRRTLADRERAQGARHPQTMTTRLGLADTYLASGQAKEAVAAYKRVVADRERVLGPDHLDTLTARHNLGAAYQKTGKPAAAELACEQAWAGFERVLGPRHPDTLRSRAELAQLYRQLGRYGDARALLHDTVDRLERILPDADPLIIELRRSLADIGEE